MRIGSLVKITTYLHSCSLWCAWDYSVAGTQVIGKIYQGDVALVTEIYNEKDSTAGPSSAVRVLSNGILGWINADLVSELRS